MEVKITVTTSNLQTLCSQGTTEELQMHILALARSEAASADAADLAVAAASSAAPSAPAASPEVPPPQRDPPKGLT